MPPSSRLPATRGNKARPTSMLDLPSSHLKRLQQVGVGDNVDVDGPMTSKQSKRRSLLPTFSKKQSGEDEQDNAGTIRDDTSDSEVATRPQTDEERRAMPPPPSKPARPTSSMRLPGATIPTRTTSVHARTASKDSTGASSRAGHAAASTTSQKLDSGLKRAGSTRVAHPSRTGGPANAINQQTIPTRSSSTRVAVSATAQKRSSALPGKTPASDTNRSLTSPSPTPTSPTRNGTRSHMPPPSSRPAFSTYQQHYSPAKSALPKPGLPTAKAARPAATPTGDTELAITPEIALEQIELLQLSLLHASAAETIQDFEASAKGKLMKQHEKLQREYEALRSHEQEHRMLRNLNALDTWCPDAALLTEHLQTLSRIVTDLRAHTDPGSRHSELVETFDAWMTKAEAILLDEKHAATFIEALPESWRTSHTSLALKLRSIQRDIRILPPAPPRQGTNPPSSLENVLENCSSLVDNMLRELDTMTKLQKEVLQRGKARIDEQIDALMSASSRSQGGEKVKWIPAWQSVA